MTIRKILTKFMQKLTKLIKMVRKCANSPKKNLRLSSKP